MKYAKYLIGGAFAAAGFYFAMPAALSAMTLTQFVLPTAAAAVLGYIGYNPVARLFSNLFAKSNVPTPPSSPELSADSSNKEPSPKASPKNSPEASPKVDQRDVRVLQAGPQAAIVQDHEDVREELNRAALQSTLALQASLSSSSSSSEEDRAEEVQAKQAEEDKVVEKQPSPVIVHRQVQQVQQQEELPRRSPRLEEERQKNPNYKY